MTRVLQPHSPEVDKPEMAKPEMAKPGALHRPVCLQPELACSRGCQLPPCVPFFPENILLWEEHLIWAHGGEALCRSPSRSHPPEGRAEASGRPVGGHKDGASAFLGSSLHMAKDLVCQAT